MVYSLFVSKKKEDRVQKLLERLDADAKESVARLIEKHSQEMLDMISQRLSMDALGDRVSKARLWLFQVLLVKTA